MTAPFEVSIQEIFHGCDEESLQQTPNGPFSATLRSFLVDSILQEITIDDDLPLARDMAKDLKKLTSAKSESDDKKGSFF